jgi:putative ABC transport system permease protein
LTAPRFFREALANELANPLTRICPVILARGGCTHAESRATVQHVNVIGVDEYFWQLSDARVETQAMVPAGRVILNQTLADELHAAPGDDILLRLGKPTAVSTETLLGRRDDTTLTLRLAVRSVIPAEHLGAFSLNPRQTAPRNAYVPLDILQRALGQPARVNALLADVPDGDIDSLGVRLKQHLRLEDLGLRLRVDTQHNYVAVESKAFLLEPVLEQAARSAATAIGTPTTGVLAYLANTIAVDSRPDAAIPYSTVAAVEPPDEILQCVIPTQPSPPPTLSPGQILLNEWAARDLQATPGDRIQLSFYVTGPLGELRNEQAEFLLTSVVKLRDAAADPGFVPEYPGVTDTNRLTDWNPPFPVDLKKIRDQDEVYWDQYRTTPKAFVTLADGQRLWATQPERLGRLTSLRLHPRPEETLETTRAAFERALLDRLDPAQVGLRFDAVRQRALDASAGATDFGGLFLGFSFFLIISAGMLVALLFRLGVERRSSEVGLLLAVGFSPGQVIRLLLIEGVLLASIAAAAGLLVARGYAWLMLAGLRSWWADAVHTPFLRLHDHATSYIVGGRVNRMVIARPDTRPPAGPIGRDDSIGATHAGHAPRHGNRHHCAGGGRPGCVSEHACIRNRRRLAESRVLPRRYGPADCVPRRADTLAEHRAADHGRPRRPARPRAPRVPQRRPTGRTQCADGRIDRGRHLRHHRATGNAIAGSRKQPDEGLGHRRLRPAGRVGRAPTLRSQHRRRPRSTELDPARPGRAGQRNRHPVSSARRR